MDTKLLIASGATAVVLLTAPVARAGLLLEYSTDGGTSFTPLTCNPTGPGSCSVPSTPISNGVFDWALQGTTAVSNSPGPPNPNLLVTNIGSLSNNAGTAQTIEFLIGDTGFTTPTPSGLDLISSISGTPGSDPLPPPDSTLSFNSCLDPLDRQNYCAGVLAINTPTVQIPFTEGGPTFTRVASTTVPVIATSPYSLTVKLIFTLQPFSSVGVTSDTDVAAVPEPASIALLGVGLFGMRFLRRRGGRASGVESNQAG